MRYNKDIGNNGENIAAKFLEDKGFTVLSRNFRFKRYGEIDIIAVNKDLLIFVEVKTRNNKSYGGALYSINNRKKKTIRLTAKYFLSVNKIYGNCELTCRFDMIALINNRIEWIQDIFR